MNYNKVVSGIREYDAKAVIGAVFEIDEGLYVRLLADDLRPAFAWSPMIYGKWDPYRVTCPVESIPEKLLHNLVSTLSRIEKPSPTDIMGGRATYEHIVELFGEIE
ncbi:MAG: hypothetical protein RSD95_16825 [Clostridia bacterium]